MPFFSIKEILKQFKKVLENREIIEEFNRTVFESIVDKVVVGRIDKDGTVHPYDLAFYFKTGIKDSQNSNKFKDKRKNAKDNDINNCAPTRMTRIINYVPKQKTTHVECIALIQRVKS